MNGPELLQRMYDALKEDGRHPTLTADGRGIVADCPCCGETRGLLFHLDGADASTGEPS
jgi:hypothetical protein